MNVLILCAGLGTRLRPLTEKTPKPLIRIGEQTVLDYQLQSLAPMNVSKIAINTHHLAEQLHDFARDHGHIHCFYEEELLGTAGPLARLYAEGWQKDLLVLNCDLMHNFDLTTFVKSAQNSGAPVALLTLDDARINTLMVGENKNLVGIKNQFESQESAYFRTFSGISWYSAQALAQIPQGLSDIRQFWKSLIEKNQAPYLIDARSLNSQDLWWEDMGSHETLATCRARFSSSKSGEAKGISTSKIDPKLLQLCGVKPDITDSYPLVGEAGSGRQYYRIPYGQESRILMDSPSADADFHSFYHLCEALENLSIPVPKIYGKSEAFSQILLEDLGSLSLWDYVQTRQGNTEEIYRKVIEMLADWQNKTRSFVAEEWLKPAFDKETWLWETAYGAEHALQYQWGINPLELKEDFENLALRMSTHPQVLVHRDCQSQNIMIAGRGPVWIDFQGARYGSVWYDLASLLWDPYIEFDNRQIRQYFAHYCLAAGFTATDGHWRAFLEASWQRVLQANGAYGCLTRIKNRPGFAQWIQPGLRQLTQLAVAWKEGRFKSLNLLTNVILEQKNSLRLEKSK